MNPIILTLALLANGITWVYQFVCPNCGVTNITQSSSGETFTIACPNCLQQLHMPRAAPLN